MTQALHIALADEVVALLAGQTFVLPMVVRRYYVPFYRLDRDGDLTHALVVPRSRQSERVSRAERQREVGLDVGIMRRVPEWVPEGLQEVGRGSLDDLSALVGEVEDFLADAVVPSYNARPVAVQVDPIYSPEHLEQWSQFTSVVTVSYRV